MVSRQCRSRLQIAGVAGIVAGVALGASFVQQVIASCTQVECVNTSCYKELNPLDDDKKICIERNKTHGSPNYHNTAHGGTAVAFDPAQTYTTRKRGTCSGNCDPERYPLVAACSGTGGTDDFAGSTARKHCPGISSS